MPESGGRERGRRRVTEHLIPDCALRPPREPDRDLPVVVLLGSPGSGRTTVLEAVDESCAASAALPYAWLDQVGGQYTRPWQLAVDLAARLGSTRWSGFGSLRFPRLTLGATVLQDDGINLSNAVRAREDLLDLLRRLRKLDTAVSRVEQLLQQLATVPPLPPWAGAAVPVVGWAMRSKKAVELLFRTGMGWYGNRGHGTAGDGFGALVDLNRLERDGGAAGRQDVDQVLCEAFLADLTAAFGSRGHPCNCVVLLDHAEREVARAFLDTLVSVRARSAAAPGYRCDPLLLVAAADRWLGFGPGWARPWDQPPESGVTRVAHGADEVGYRAWADHRPPPTFEDAWWYPVVLGDLSREEVQRAAAGTRPRELSRMADFVHRLTSGHPLATDRVLATLAAQPDTPMEEQQRSVLDLPAPTAGGTAERENRENGDRPSLGDQLLDELFPDFRSWLTDPAQWAAALDIESVLGLPTTEAEGREVRALREQLENRLWLVARGEDGSSTGLHPFLRRLLLRELARRPDTDPNSWDRVHQRLHDHHAELGESDRACYHALALGRLGPVVDLFNERFDQWRTPEEWIAAFQQATSAPNRLPRDSSPHQLFADLVGDGEASAGDSPPPVHDPHRQRRSALLHMAAAHWIDADPLLDPELTLSRHLADGYAWLGRAATHGSHYFLAEADRYHRLGPP